MKEEDKFWDDMERYKTPNGDYDLSDVNDDNILFETFKHLNEEDGIIVKDIINKDDYINDRTMKKLWNEEGYVTDQALAKRIFKIWHSSLSSGNWNDRKAMVERIDKENITLDEEYNLNWEFEDGDSVGDYGIIQHIDEYIEILKQDYPEGSTEELFIDDEVGDLMKFHQLITLSIGNKLETFILSEID